MDAARWAKTLTFLSSFSGSMLFVMGDKDDTALGPTKDMALLTKVIKKMPAKPALHIVPRAGHNPLDAPKSVREESHVAILAAVQKFIVGA